MSQDDSFGECLARLDQKQDLVDALEMIATSEGNYWLNKIASEKEWSKPRTTAALEDLTEMGLISETQNETATPRGFVGRRKPYVITEKGKRALNWLREHKEDIGNARMIKEIRQEDEHIQKNVKDYIIEILIEERHFWREQAERLKTDLDDQLNEQIQRAWREANVKGTIKASPSDVRSASRTDQSGLDHPRSSSDSGDSE